MGSLLNFKIIILVIVFVAGGLLLFKYRQQIKKFLQEVKAELSKVAWSTREELVSSTLVVIVITGIMGIFIGIIDFLLSQGLSTLLK
jgi:preprotein translocase subunit SecE